MRLIIAFSALIATNATAAPNVVTDIAPIHGLVSAVMGEVGAPTLLLPANADAHSYTMRPSDAQTLADADIMVWVGAGLTPWLEAPLEALAPDAEKLALLLSEGWTPRALAQHDDDHDGHGHGEIDPHAWMDPAVAGAWLAKISEALSAADPDNAATYQANAAAAAAEFATLRIALSAQMAPFAGRGVIWPHDAYGYFADAFGMTSLGAISESDAADPGPAHIAELRKITQSGDVVCVLLDAEVSPSWGDVLTDGTAVKTAQIDGIGADIPLGAGFYPTLMTQFATALTGCLRP